MSICYITLFLDIGRSEWNTIFRRSFDTYLEHFLPFINLFEPNIAGNDEMIAFIDRKHITTLRSVLTLTTRIKLIEIDTQWMEQLPIWKTLDRERAIMQYDKFQEQIPTYRKACPETYIPEYTLINHCKIDLLALAIQQKFTTAEYFAWVDFGMFKQSTNIPKRLIDINLIAKNKINYTLLNPIKEECKTLSYLQLVAPENIAGYLFIGHQDKILEYQKLYHNILNHLQNNSQADDDQVLALLCYFTQPNLFNLIPCPIWHYGLILLQKQF